VAAARPDPAPQAVLDPAWDPEAVAARVRADQAQQAAREAAFDQVLREWLPQTEPGPG
jgi:hypothetical protein